MHTRPVWAEISRSRLIGNYGRLRSLAGGSADVLAVVKGDAYGHSAAICAPWLAAAGAEWLGVTSTDEGVAMRGLCPDAQILVMAVMCPAEADAVLDARLTPAVWDPLHLDALGAAAARRHLPDGSVPVHLEIDTGMSRQGVAFAASAPGLLKAVLDHLRGVPALRLDGVFTHFASPEVADAAENHLQLERFRGAVELVAREGFRPRWIHGGNSTTLLRRAAFEPVFAALAEKYAARLLWRPGLALYGYSMTAGDDAGLVPVLAWKTRIASLRNISAGTAVGYGGTFVARRAMRLALLPVGYADGLNRKLSNSTTANPSDCSHVLVGGAAAQIVGRVSMDLTTIDVSHVPNVAVGDEVAILGEQNGLRITAADHAAWAETIPYEVLCGIAARVPRMRVD